jgi:hypothetical protein
MVKLPVVEKYLFSFKQTGQDKREFSLYSLAGNVPKKESYPQ